MGAEVLSSRAIIGKFFLKLAQDLGQSWIDPVSMYITSDQESETYKWLGMVPAMREWIGGRQPKGFRDFGITIVNKHYEATLEVWKRERRRDKTGQLDVRIGEFAQRANSHWASLLSSLIINGDAQLCYDGQYFFDTDHSEGSSGTQSNKISVDISALPVSQHGSTTAPSAEEMQQTILQGCQAFLGFKDDQGEPMNENARDFVVMVPVSLWQPAITAVGVPQLSSGQTNVIQSGSMDGFKIRVVSNARLTFTDKFCIFRGDGDAKAFIRQEEMPLQLKVIGEGSELEFNEDKHHYGIDTWRNVGYGFWQKAVQMIMT